MLQPGANAWMCMCAGVYKCDGVLGSSSLCPGVYEALEITA